MAQAATAATTRHASPRRVATRAMRETTSFYFFISPWLAGFVFLSVVPLVLGLLTSFTNFDGYNLEGLKWVGVQQFDRALHDSEFYYSLKRTFFYTGLSVPIGLASSFAMALMLNTNIMGQGVFRTIWYIPAILPVVASAWVWKLFGSANTGLMNALISLVRPGTAILWLQTYATYTLIVFSLWAGVGRGMVIFLAGLQGIPEELQEAAAIDGANRWHVFWNVILPLMTPVLFFELVMNIIGALQVMQNALLLAETGEGMNLVISVPRANYMLAVHIYATSFYHGNMAFGVAMLWLLFAIILALTVFVFRSTRYWVYYEVDQEGGAK
jgi:multiple sugar transport system permease protein